MDKLVLKPFNSVILYCPGANLVGHTPFVVPYCQTRFLCQFSGKNMVLVQMLINCFTSILHPLGMTHLNSWILNPLKYDFK